jgi:ABC-type antimicrobial peptide transport system permease subunit
MLRPRWRKVLHDLWSNKARTLLVIASIAVGVFAIGVITGAYVLLSEDLSASYAAVNGRPQPRINQLLPQTVAAAPQDREVLLGRKGRLALTLTTLTLGGAIFMAVLNTQAALDRKVEDSIKYFQADVNLDFARPYRMDKVRSNEAFWADLPGLAAGDVLRLKIAGKEKDWTVVGIFQYTGVDELIGYVNYDYLTRELNEVNRASVYRIVTEEHTLAFQERVGSLLEERFRSLGYRIASVQSGAAFAASITDVLRILVVVLLAMALLTALVGSIGLAGTMSMNVLERTREIGVLRAIDAHNQIVSKLVIVEGMAIGLISFALGSVLSLPITSLLSNVISLSVFDSPAAFVVTAQSFGIWLGLVLLLSAGASVLPARNATQLTIREVLAYE